MKKRKKRKSLFDDLFGFSLFEDMEDIFEGFFSDFGEEGLSGSYSIQVTYTDEGPVVYAELSDDIDANKFRKMLEQKYPGAKIVIKGGKTEERFKVNERTPEKRVEIKLGEEKEEGEIKKEKEEESIFNALYGKKRTFIKREE